MTDFRFLRFALLNILLVANIATTLKGGIWLWAGFIVLMTLSFPINELFGDDTGEAETSYNWALNANIFATLPLVLLNTLALITIASPALPSPVRVLAVGIEQARASTGGWDVLGGCLSLGLFYALVAIAAHDLVHRVNSPAAQIVGRWLFAFNLDTTFPIEHVYGHHRYVGTKRDPTTARRGENAFTFFVRSTCGQFVSAFRFEAERLRHKGKRSFSFRNRAIRGQFMSMMLGAICLVIGGPTGLALLLACAIQGKFYVELLNYIAHYGLVRAEAGSIEVRHSWNMRRRISGALLLNLPRHSHHHMFPAKPFWMLVAEPDGPQLPYGHTTMMLISVVPPLWNSILDPLLKDWDLRFASAEERAILVRDGKLLGTSRAESGSEPVEESADSCMTTAGDQARRRASAGVSDVARQAG